MSYHVKLQTFEGPLDLLLHLVNKAKVKIEDISITEITEQYLNYLDKMKKFDIEIASEFLVMAATLLYIKSRTLIPLTHGDAEEEEVDPKQELIRRLEEYKKYKEASLNLRKREEIYSNIFYKLPEEMVEKTELDSLFTGLTTEDLFKAFEKLMSRKRFVNKVPMVHGIKRDPITIKDRIKQLKVLFETKPEFSFYEIFDDHYNRSDIIVTFLALLEMLKANLIKLYQDKPFEDIIIKRRDHFYG